MGPGDRARHRDRLELRYGPHLSNRGELWVPPDASGPVPVVMLVHGGFWRAAYTKRLMRPMASAVLDAGWAAWNVEYRRTGLLGGGGGWPGTFLDVAAAIDHLADVEVVDPTRVVTCGHSAGGHLALWAAARSRLPRGAPGADPRVTPRGVVSLAGVVDLESAATLGLGDGAVERLMGGTTGRRPERYALGSPAALLPFGVPQVLIHGTADGVVPLTVSETYQRRASALGDEARFVALDGVDHMAVIDPRSPTWPVTVATLADLLA